MELINYFWFDILLIGIILVLLLRFTDNLNIVAKIITSRNNCCSLGIYSKYHLS